MPACRNKLRVRVSVRVRAWITLDHQASSILSGQCTVSLQLNFTLSDTTDKFHHTVKPAPALHPKPNPIVTLTPIASTSPS